LYRRIPLEFYEMKAIRVEKFGGPNVLKLVSSLPLPVPNAGEALIRVHYAGVNPVDTYIRSGQFSRVPNLPYTPGSDCAGEIVALPHEDEKKGKFHIGQRVFTTGTLSGSYGSHALASVNAIHHLPDSLSFAQGAAIGVPYFTAYRAVVTKGRLNKDQTVLIHGASGAVGIACCQIASYIGAKVLGTVGTEEGSHLVKQHGAIETFSHKKLHVEEVMKYTDNRGVDLIVEMLADQNLNEDCEMCAQNGAIQIVGSRGSLHFDPRATMLKEVCIRGIALMKSTPEEWKEASEFLGNLFEKGVFKPVVGKEFPLEEASAAHEFIIHNSGSHGKVVLNCE
jgi:NADPH:quinone reductase